MTNKLHTIVCHPGPMLVVTINAIEPAMEALVKKGTDFSNKFRTTSSELLSSGKHVHEMYAPLNPNFIVMGIQWYTYFYLFLFQNMNCGYSLEPSRRGGFYVYTPSVFKLN